MPRRETPKRPSTRAVPANNAANRTREHAVAKDAEPYP